jgi:hypothetical protein
MIYDLVIAYGWLPRDVRELTAADLEGIGRAAERRERRARKG